MTRLLRDMVLLPADPSRPDGRGRDLPACSPAQTTGYRWVRRGVRALGECMRRTLLVALTALLVSAPAAQADGGHGGGELREYAKGTWASFEAMTDERSGLPADILNADGSTSVQTSTTNIGAYMWSAVAAEELGFIGKHELVARLSRTLSTLERMERHAPSGQFYNWYDHRTGAKLTTWPPTGAPLTPILSSVDNGWLATGLKIVENSVPQLKHARGQALRLDELRASTTGRTQPHPVPLRARHRRGAVLLRHRRLREPDRRLHRHRPGPDAAEGLLRAQPLVPGHVRRRRGRRPSRSASPRPTSASTSSRARCPTRA